MATKASRKKAPARKPAQKKAAPKAKAPAKAVKTAKKPVLKAPAGANTAFKARDKYFNNAFGAAGGKAKYFSLAGAPLAAAEAAKENVCIAQYAPGPGRLTWLYVTHGIAELGGKGSRASCELVLHWKQVESAPPLKVLTAAARQLAAGEIIKADTILIGEKPSTFGVAGLPQWFACTPDKLVPEKIGETRSPVKFLLLLGITEAEMQVALKVNPELADGRQVLAEALRTSGVYPVSDPKRTCMTRRGDFHRLWETAFRIARERGEAHRKAVLK